MLETVEFQHTLGTLQFSTLHETKTLHVNSSVINQIICNFTEKPEAVHKLWLRGLEVIITNYYLPTVSVTKQVVWYRSMGYNALHL